MVTKDPTTQTMHLPLDGGMDQITHPRHVDPTAALDAVNLRYMRVGGTEKRPGHVLYADITGSGFVAGAGKLAAFRNELVLTDGHTIGSATTTSGSNKFTAKDRYPEAIPSTRGITGTPNGGSQPDLTYSSANGGFFVYAWSGSKDYSVAGDIYVTVEDATTGTEIQSAFKATSGATYFRPRLVTCGSTVILLYIDSGANIIKRIWDPVTATWGSATNIVTARSAASDFDACATATRVYVVYRSNTNVTTVKSFDSSMAAVATKASTEAAVDTNGFSICATAGEVVWITYQNTTATQISAAGFNDTLATETTAAGVIYTAAAGETLVRTGVCRKSATEALVLTSAWTTDGQNSIVTIFNTALATSVVGRKNYWTTMGSRPFVASTSPLRICAWVYAGGARYDTPSFGEQSLQWTFILADLNADDTATSILPMRPITWVAPRVSVVEGVLGGGHPVASVQVGTKWYSIARLSRNNAGRTSFLRAAVDFSSAALGANAELGQTLYFAPGWYWDRSRLAEISYCYWPQKASTPTFSNTGGGLLVAGKTYRRRATYEFIDANGFVHRSQPSDYVEFTVTGGNNTATYKVPNLTMTARQDAAGGFYPAVTITVWGTQPTDVDALTYYRLFSEDATPQNTVSAESATITDKGNALLTTQPTLNTAILPNVQPAGFSAVCTYNNRLWIAYGNIVMYSKAFVTGESVGFTDAFELPLEESGDVTALWVMDGALFISTANRLYYLEAYGPADNGTDNDVRPPSRIATDLGCIEPRSVVVTPIGTVYQSAISVGLLDRSRQVSADPIGYKVKTELDTYPTVTSAVVHPTGGYFMLTIKDAGSGGERLVFDYSRNAWSRDTLIGGKQIISTAVAQGLVCLLTSDGNVYLESSSTYLDAGTWVTARLRKPWLHPAGLQGYQWVHRAIWQGEKFTSHDLSIAMYVDYAASATKTWTFPATGGSTPLDSMPLPQVSVDPPQNAQRSQAVSFEISDATPTGASIGTGRGSAFVGLAVDIQTEGNSWELPAAQKG